MVGAGGWDKITNLLLLRLNPWQGLASILGLSFFISLELLSRATFEGLALQMLQLMGALHPVLGDDGFVATALWLEVGGSLTLGACSLPPPQARLGPGSQREPQVPAVGI